MSINPVAINAPGARQVAPAPAGLPISTSLPPRTVALIQGCSIKSEGMRRMSPGLQILMMGSLNFGVPLALAVRDLWKHRPGHGGSWQPEPPAPTPPPPVNNTDPITPPLPACLIDAARIEERPRVRVLELA